ncbi:MAG: hypothetical protein Q4C22_02880 [Bacillota bacterium]|nr:hypothetical protein [Bacillota bacterium]
MEKNRDKRWIQKGLTLLLVLVLALAAGCTAGGEATAGPDTDTETEEQGTPAENGEPGETPEGETITVTLRFEWPEGSLRDQLEASHEVSAGTSLLDASVSFGEKIMMVVAPDQEGLSIIGINDVFEGDLGDDWVWVCYVNDEIPEGNASEHILQEGDFVRWVYEERSGS